MKLLLRFFLNHNLTGYLQGLSKELGENTNSIRVELNRLEAAGILNSEFQGRRKIYHVNEAHPLTSDITSIMRKVSGIDALVDRVVENLPGLRQVWVGGDLVRGVESEIIYALLIGEEIAPTYIRGLSKKVEKLTGKKVQAQILERIPSEKAKECLLVWEKFERD